MANAMVKLPGGCYLAERTDDVKKLNVRQLNVIPFRKYRLDPVVEESDEEDSEEQELTWTETAIVFTAVGTLIMAGLATGWMSFLIMAIGFMIVTILAALME